jgi:hypothetical protein
MFLKRHVRRKDGKRHVYYSLCESTRVSPNRVRQRRLLNLGELNTTQREAWQRTIEVIEENGQAAQKRLFTDQEGEVPEGADICEVRLSSLRVRKPRQFGNCWLGCRLFEELQLDRFFGEQLATRRGPEDWAKVVELLAVNRLCAPGSELSIHERWFDRTAMSQLLGTGPEVAGKDRLYRTLDKIVELKPALEKHLAQRWQDLFEADTQVLLYDLTSTYFEGSAAQIEKAAYGYSRDHRGDCRQIVLALVVTPEGLPLTYRVFPGNTNDSTTLSEILDTIEAQYDKQDRIWVFDRALVSERFLWHHLSMKTRAAAVSALKTIESFQKGQVWKIGELNLAVTLVGKTLVHYKRYTVNPRGIQTTLTTKTDLRKYLLSCDAVLVAE